MESGRFFLRPSELALRSCLTMSLTWPQQKLNEIHASPAHLLVIADTQVLDSHSLPSVRPWLRRLVHFIVESNLRKNWIGARNLKPEGVLFLGDMINGGRYARSDEE
jgi:ethanolamine phosphate phosphodiesterase